MPYFGSRPDLRVVCAKQRLCPSVVSSEQQSFAKGLVELVLFCGPSWLNPRFNCSSWSGSWAKAAARRGRPPCLGQDRSAPSSSVGTSAALSFIVALGCLHFAECFVASAVGRGTSAWLRMAPKWSAYLTPALSVFPESPWKKLMCLIVPAALNRRQTATGGSPV